MKLIKTVLAALGLLLLVFLALAALLLRNSSEFLDENKPFVEQFTRDLSRSWSVSDVHESLSNEFLRSLDTPEGQEGMKQLKLLGAVVEMSDFEMGNYNATTSGATGIINFKAAFENAKGLVTITLMKRNGKVQVQGFHVSLADGVRPSAGKTEA